jgi:hypothetical protein
VEVGTNAVPVDPDGMTVVLVKATTGPQPLSYVGMGALVGSTNASPATTGVIFGLYSDNNGVPGSLILDTSNAEITFNDPSPLQAVQSGGFISDQMGGFAGLTPNTTYWVYMKAGVGGNSGSTAGVSTAQCIQANWINNQPPAQYSYFSGQTACPNAYQVYLVVSYP